MCLKYNLSKCQISADYSSLDLVYSIWIQFTMWIMLGLYAKKPNLLVVLDEVIMDESVILVGI